MMELLSIDEIEMIEKLDNKEKSPTIAPKISTLREADKYEILESTITRIRIRQTSPEYLLLCRVVKTNEVTLFHYHEKVSKVMTLSDLKHYINEYKINHNAKAIPEGLNDLLNLYITYEEKKSLEQKLEDPIHLTPSKKLKM
jgi:hypothetical protein